MSIGLQFTGRIDHPEELLEAAAALAKTQGCRLTVGKGGLKIVLCPLGGELDLRWRPGEDQSWQVWGGCVSTPAGAGLHRAAVELLDRLPIRALTVEDETGFFQHRDFLRIKEEHFYPWLHTLVDVCRQESGKGVSGMQLCWDLEQYAPENIPDTVVTPMGRFRLSELVDLVEEGGIEALAGRFFLWNGRTQDARFFRNRAINALWERCWFAPSARSQEDAAINSSILDDLEWAAKLDPALPLPRRAYAEVCALAEREPALPEGPELREEFSPGYRKGRVTHAVGVLRLTLPGSCLYHWESWENDGGAHLWSDGSDEGPVWRVSAYRAREGDAQFTDNLNTLHGLEARKLSGGALRWGWREIREEGKLLYQAVCEVISGPSLFLLTAACSGPEDLGQVAQTIAQLSVVHNAARMETVQAKKESGGQSHG
ncbi:hypothetical protein [Lawsonibacter sp. JLR.KK007]|jgi:hypothetical protein|uniref:hypothetical protein n=1 Tax=Lawsonibacter sp. JLR.KK007 TaxID=3114293 RepID=UPI002FEF7621